MSVNHTANALGVSPDTIRRWAREGSLEAGQVIARAPCVDTLALVGAIHAYEMDMQTYGFEAVRSSMPALQAALRFDSSYAVAVARIVLRIINAVPPLKQKIFAGFGDA